MRLKLGLCVRCGQFQPRGDRPEIWTCADCTVPPRWLAFSEAHRRIDSKNWEKIRIGQAAGCRF